MHGFSIARIVGVFALIFALTLTAPVLVAILYGEPALERFLDHVPCVVGIPHRTATSGIRCHPQGTVGPDLDQATESFRQVIQEPFRAQDLRAHFSKQSWYTVNAGFRQDDLTEEDQANITVVRNYERGLIGGAGPEAMREFLLRNKARVFEVLHQ